MNKIQGVSIFHLTVGSVTKGLVDIVVCEVQICFKIKYEGQTAYVSKVYVTKGGSSDNVTQGNNKNNNQNNNVTVQTSGTYVVNATSLRDRKGTATSNSLIGGVLKVPALNLYLIQI